jgi:RNA polymerase sigma-70 factor (ECF subfamily)
MPLSALRILSRSGAVDRRALADEDLMELVRRGDSRAFAVVYDRHAAVAYSLAHRICGRRAAAEEVVQEAFLAAWRARASYASERGGLRTWILTLVRNRAIDALRHASVTTSRDVHDGALSAALPTLERTDAEVERRSEAELVRDALRDLPGDQQRVIELAFFGGFTHTEIAVMLGLPAGTVKGRMRLGLTKLRAALGEQIGAPA